MFQNKWVNLLFLVSLMAIVSVVIVKSAKVVDGKLELGKKK